MTEASLLRELRDREALALASGAGLVTFLMAGDWRLSAIAAGGVILVRIAAGLALHGTHPPPRKNYPGLSTRESAVAWYVYRGRGDPAIARRTDLTLRQVRESVASIKRKWEVSTREEVASHVAEIEGDLPSPRPPRKQGREWMVEFALALAVIGIGVTVLAAASDAPVIGGIRDPLGLGLLAAGIVFAAVSTVTYLWEKAQSTD